MCDYEKLIKALRHCAADDGGDCDTCPYSADAKACSYERVINTAADAIEELLAAVPKWISVDERLPDCEIHVLVYVKTRCGGYVCDAFRTGKLSTPCSYDDDIDADYDEDTDEYYFPKGWWEIVKNWDDYSCIAVVDGIVTHWMPLPEPPKVVE